MREALANEIFRDRGVAAPRVAFYRIVVNTGTRDESWGLYTLVEDPADPAMLASQFGGASGNLYKPDGPGADWTTFDREGFEKKTNKATADFSDIQAAIEALHADLPLQRGAPISSGTSTSTSSCAGSL
jgi:spore coat protein H